MYERSAIVLERYYTNVLKFDEKPNLKMNYKNFKDLVEEIQKYQTTLEKEETVIYEFDTIANGIRAIQQEQKKIYKLNIRLEEERNQLFENLDENPALLERKLQKVQETIIKNNERLEELKAEFVNYLSVFNEKQQERNICSRERRTEEQQYLKLIEETNEIIEEIALEGKIDKICEILEKYLNNLSNRDYIKFDEKYVKLIFYCIAMNLKIYNVKSEMEVQRKYPDILLVPRDKAKGYKAIMVEFKYLKKGEENRLEEKQKEAREQIEEYASFEEIKDIENLSKYTIVSINDKLYIEKI